MPGLDDLIGSLQQGAGRGSAGAGLEGMLGGLLGGGSSSGGGGLGDLLGGAASGGSSGAGGLGGLLGGMLGGTPGGGSPASSSGSGSGSGMLAMLAPLLASLLANGGLQQILGGMRANGFSAQADSWVSTGENLPIGPEQVTQALGSSQVEQVAAQLGVGPEQASQVLARILPGLVNSVTPDGAPPAEADLSRLAQTLQGLVP